MKKVGLLANSDISVLWKMTPHSDGKWGNVDFNPENQEEYDYIIVLNHPLKSCSVKVPKENIWALMQEPYLRGRQEYMVEKHDLYSKVFTHYPPSSDKKYIVTPPLTPWFLHKKYEELEHLPVPEKCLDLSCVSSTKTIYPGHKKRLSFINYLTKCEDLHCDFFGKGICEISDKWDALADYKYSIAIENTSKLDYWTEKISDCFLSYTVPIYYGCTNILEYFPADSYIYIDITQPSLALKKIQEIIKEDDWDSRLRSLEKARNLVLDEYNFFSFMVKRINEVKNTNNLVENVVIPKYNYRSVNNIKKYSLEIIKNYLN